MVYLSIGKHSTQSISNKINTCGGNKKAGVGPRVGWYIASSILSRRVQQSVPMSCDVFQPYLHPTTPPPCPDNSGPCSINSRIDNINSNFGETYLDILDLYLSGNLEDTLKTLDEDQYNELNRLLNEQNNSCPENAILKKVKGILKKSLETIYKCMLKEKSLVQEIEILKDTINDFQNKSKLDCVLGLPASVASVRAVANVKREVVIYIERYGMPENFKLDPIRLSEILAEIETGVES